MEVLQTSALPLGYGAVGVKAKARLRESKAGLPKLVPGKIQYSCTQLRDLSNWVTATLFITV